MRSFVLTNRSFFCRLSFICSEEKKVAEEDLIKSDGPLEEDFNLCTYE